MLLVIADSYKLRFLYFKCISNSISFVSTACEPVHGPLLISGLGIIALAELLGLVYMKFVGKLILLFKPLQRISDI